MRVGGGRVVLWSELAGGGGVRFRAPRGAAVRDLVTDPPVNWRAIFNGPSETPCRRVAIGHTAARRSARSAEVGGSPRGWISASVPEGRLTIPPRFHAGAQARAGTPLRPGALDRPSDAYLIHF